MNKEEMYRLEKIQPNWYRLQERKCLECGRGGWRVLADFYDYRLAQKMFKLYLKEQEK